MFSNCHLLSEGDILFSDTSFDLSVLRKRAFNMRWAEQPDGVIPLTAADPDFPAAPCIRDAIIRYAREGYFSYGPPGGLPDFRVSVARYLRDRRQFDCHPEGVIAVNSAASGLAIVARFLLSPGDEAVVMDPCDFLFAHTVEAAGGVVRRWPIDRSGPLDFDRLASLCGGRTKMLCVCNPHNPLGRCFTREELLAIGEFCLRRNIWMLSDEIWSDITYGPAKFHSMMSLTQEIRERTILVHGLSKSHGLAGLRIGYIAVARPALRQDILNGTGMSSTVDGAATLSQVAAGAALDEGRGWLEAFLNHLTARRDQCVSVLMRSTPLGVIKPDSTYVLWIKLPAGTPPSDVCAEVLRDRFGVAIVPGTPRWFGPGAEGHIRLCFATSTAILSEGLERLSAGFEVLAR